MATQIIFDTNAYRELTYGKDIFETIALINEIKKKEAAQNISAFASPIVWTELFCHLSDPEDLALENCYCALICSFIHCMQNEDTGSYKLIADGDDLLVNLLFDYVNPITENLYHGFAEAIRGICNNATWKNNQVYTSYFKTIKAASDKEEMDFLIRYKEIADNYAKRTGERKKMLSLLKSEELFHSVAETQVLKALANTKGNTHGLTYMELNEKTELVKSYFPAALHLGIYIIAKMIIAPGFDMTKKKRHNWVWDYQLLFAISNANSNILVTDDKAMLDAAKMANLEDKIMKLADYKAFLNI